jgi:hypothetical protein
MRRHLILAVLLAAACRRAELPPLNVDDVEVTSVSIARGADALVLVQGPPGRWRVDPLKGVVDAADGPGAAALLAGLRDLRTDYALSGDGAAEGLSSADATEVAVFASGRTAPVFQARFGRRALGRAVHASAPGGGPVYLVEGPSPSLLARGAGDWRDARLLGADCTRVAVDAGGGFKNASPETSAALCGARASAMTGDLPADVTGLGRPALRVRAGGAALAVGARVGGERWIRVDGRPGLFRAAAEPFETAAADAAR